MAGGRATEAGPCSFFRRENEREKMKRNRLKMRLNVCGTIVCGALHLRGFREEKDEQRGRMKEIGQFCSWPVVALAKASPPYAHLTRPSHLTQEDRLFSSARLSHILPSVCCCVCGQACLCVRMCVRPSAKSLSSLSLLWTVLRINSYRV